MNESIKKEIAELMEKAKVFQISSVDELGYPNTKSVLCLQNDGIKTHYISTNLSAKRTQQYLKNPKACIYFSDSDCFMGLMLVGTMEVCTDRHHKEMLWREGFEMYYPKGIDDEDYCVLKFTSEWGNYYHGLQNTTFRIEEYMA